MFRPVDRYFFPLLTAAVLGLVLQCGMVGAGEPETEIVEIDTGEVEEAVAREAATKNGGETYADDVVLESRECININRIRRTDIVDDYTVLFFMSGSEIYLNKLSRKCPGLKMADSFSFDTRTSRLCGIDVIRVLDSWGGSLRSGVGCGLGKFQPITEEQLLTLREEGKAEQ